jgi:predicted RNA-binding protein
MKTEILVSSKSLASALNKIDFDDNSLIAIEIMNDVINFHLKNDRVIQLPVVVGKKEIYLIEEINISWSWLKKLSNQMDEQPLLLIITPSSVNIATQW